MRGKTATLKLHRHVGEPYDEFGRPRRVPDAGVLVFGSVSPPSAVQLRGAPATLAETTAVAVIAASTPVDWSTPGLWVQVVEARHPGVEVGHYSIERRSGGRRVVRLELKRFTLQDGSHGSP